MSQILDSSSSEEEDNNEEKESEEEEEEEEEHEEEDKKKKKQHIKEEVGKGHEEVEYRQLSREHILSCLSACLSLSLRRSWTQRRGTTSCSSSTSSWKTEVGINACFRLVSCPVPTLVLTHCLENGFCRVCNRDPHQQAPSPGLQGPQPLQALQAGLSAGRLP